MLFACYWFHFSFSTDHGSDSSVRIDPALLGLLTTRSLPATDIIDEQTCGEFAPRHFGPTTKCRSEITRERLRENGRKKRIEFEVVPDCSTATDFDHGAAECSEHTASSSAGEWHKKATSSIRTQSAMALMNASRASL
jgi:hypothetical protein